MDSEALRSKVSLRVSPAALKAQGKRVLSEKIAAGELFRQAEAAGQGAAFLLRIHRSAIASASPAAAGHTQPIPSP